MAASKKTVVEIVNVFEKYVKKHEVEPMLRDLAAIEGNTSFTQTIERLRHEVVRRKLFPGEKP